MGNKERIKTRGRTTKKFNTNHFRKVNQIEMILKNADRNHEMYYETLYKIKRVIFPNANLKR